MITGLPWDRQALIASHYYKILNTTVTVGVFTQSWKMHLKGNFAVFPILLKYYRKKRELLKISCKGVDITGNVFSFFCRLCSWHSSFSWPRTQWHWAYSSVAVAGGIPEGMGPQPVLFHVPMVVWFLQWLWKIRTWSMSGPSSSWISFALLTPDHCCFKISQLGELKK